MPLKMLLFRKWNAKSLKSICLLFVVVVVVVVVSKKKNRRCHLIHKKSSSDLKNAKLQLFFVFLSSFLKRKNLKETL